MEWKSEFEGERKKRKKKDLGMLYKDLGKFLFEDKRWMRFEKMKNIYIKSESEFVSVGKKKKEKRGKKEKGREVKSSNYVRK